MTIFTLFFKVFTILAELQLMNARMVLEQENLRREKKIDTKTGISSVSMLL